MRRMPRGGTGTLPPSWGTEGNTSDDGLDRERLEDWFRESVPGAEPPLSYERIAGGRSNLTFRVSDADGGRWILRRPPLGATLGSAHDMGREHRILTGLAGTDVPTPRPIAMCTDESVTGAEFYVMELVDGLVLRDEDEVEAAFERAGPPRASARRSSTRSPTCTPSTPTPPGSGSSAAATATPSASSSAGCASGRPPRRASSTRWRRPTGCCPRACRRSDATSLVHGDYRLDNVIVTPAGRDRRRARLGAVHARRPARRRRAADGLLGRARATRSSRSRARPTLAPGFPTPRGARRALRARAPGATSRSWTSSSRSPTGSWRRSSRACYARYSAGQYGETSDEFRSFGKIVEQLADAALERRAPPRVKGASWRRTTCSRSSSPEARASGSRP